MSKARRIITAVVDEKRTKSAVAHDYDVSRYWVQQLVRRYRAEGEAAFDPHSRRPRSSPHAVPAAVEDEIVRLHKELSRQGLDAGADTIRTHLGPSHPEVADLVPGRTALGLDDLADSDPRGFVTPQPQKRPRSSWHRFEAEQPNERRQADTTHWQLADGTIVEILNLLDDHSRLAPVWIPRRTITGPDVVDAFQDAFVRWGIPAGVLTDNGAAFTGLPRRGGRVSLEIELGRLGVRFDHSRAHHPHTAGAQGRAVFRRETRAMSVAASNPWPPGVARRDCTNVDTGRSSLGLQPVSFLTSADHRIWPDAAGQRRNGPRRANAQVRGPSRWVAGAGFEPA